MSEETNNEEVQSALQVTAGDLALIVKIIDAGSERGAWKGEELGTIGNLRTKMVAIVQSVAPVQDAIEDGAEKAVDGEEAVETATEETKPKRKRAATTAA